MIAKEEVKELKAETAGGKSDTAAKIALVKTAAKVKVVQHEASDAATEANEKIEKGKVSEIKAKKLTARSKEIAKKNSEKVKEMAEKRVRAAQRKARSIKRKAGRMASKAERQAENTVEK